MPSDQAPTPIFGFDNRLPDPSGATDGLADRKPNQPYILDLVTRERLFFQSIPDTLEYDPDSTFMAIASAGRNNPLYHYIGSEDILQFQLSWYADESSREDVIRKCKWLESLSKNNGYDEKPHEVQCVFGSLFRDAKWLMVKSRYTMRLFDRQFGMFPRLAIQDIILKRITDTNRSRTEIQSIYS